MCIDIVYEYDPLKWYCDNSDVDVRDSDYSNVTEVRGRLGAELEAIEDVTMNDILRDPVYREVMVIARAAEKWKQARILRARGYTRLALVMERPYTSRTDEDQGALVDVLNRLFPWRPEPRGTTTYTDNPLTFTYFVVDREAEAEAPELPPA